MHYAFLRFCCFCVCAVVVFLHPHCYFSDTYDVYALCVHIVFVVFVFCVVVFLQSYCYVGDIYYVYALCVRTCFVVVVFCVVGFACTHIAILATFTTFMHSVFVCFLLSLCLVLLLFFALTLLCTNTTHKHCKYRQNSHVSANKKQQIQQKNRRAQRINTANITKIAMCVQKTTQTT